MGWETAPRCAPSRSGRPPRGINDGEAITGKWEMVGLCWVNEKEMLLSFGNDLKMSDTMSEYFGKKNVR